MISWKRRISTSWLKIWSPEKVELWSHEIRPPDPHSNVLPFDWFTKVIFIWKYWDVNSTFFQNLNVLEEIKSNFLFLFWYDFESKRLFFLTGHKLKRKPKLFFSFQARISNHSQNRLSNCLQVFRRFGIGQKVERSAKTEIRNETITNIFIN